MSEPITAPVRMRYEDVLTARPESPAVLEIYGPTRELLVRLDMDGSVEFGATYQPQEAARLFWQLLGECMPTRCRSCGVSTGCRRCGVQRGAGRPGDVRAGRGGAVSEQAGPRVPAAGEESTMSSTTAVEQVRATLIERLGVHGMNAQEAAAAVDDVRERGQDSPHAAMVGTAAREMIEPAMKVFRRTAQVQFKAVQRFLEPLVEAANRFVTETGRLGWR
jgi:hypothetical protein